jgi:hypothetical protein
MPADELAITSTVNDGVLALRVEGEIDISNVDDFASALRSASRRARFGSISRVSAIAVRRVSAV